MTLEKAVKALNECDKMKKNYRNIYDQNTDLQEDNDLLNAQLDAFFESDINNKEIIKDLKR